MINILTALPCEARPLIEHYRLRGNARHSAFRCYQNDEVQLLICGIGKLAAATATAYLAASEPQRSYAWLNIGIAGHATKPIGEAVLANKIIDAATGQQSFPGIVMPIPCASETLTTVDKPEPHYRETSMVDMEASGFYAAASRFQSCELIHALKIISDNQHHNTDNISENRAIALINDNIITIESVINELRQLAAELDSIKQTPAEIYAFMEQWRFTTYQQNELRLLLRRWHALTPAMPPAPHDFTEYNNSKAVLAAIKGRLDAQPIRFDEANK